ncbi:hypothetical protein LguiB_031858 [Lonicera macranthoides]
MNFPLPDKSVDAISRYVKLISLKDVNDIAREIFHPSHKHLLILLDVQSDDAEMINTELCRGCSRRISVSFYTCKDCNFFLHKCCAELPREIQHPLHAEHPLRQCWPKYFFSYTNCDLCKKFTSGFVFRCSTCNFRLDVHCACLPKAIKHDAHDHPLKLETQISRCSGCNNFTRTIYGCATCSEFNLAICCVNLSRTFKHEWDHHPLTLSYPPFSYHPDEFICEICEEDIHPNYWLYHCRQCDQSFHTNCINFDLYSDVKFGGTLQVENHPHPLVYVRKSKSKFPSICSQCGLTRYDWPVLECACCNFQLCHNCGYLLIGFCAELIRMPRALKTYRGIMVNNKMTKESKTWITIQHFFLYRQLTNSGKVRMSWCGGDQHDFAQVRMIRQYSPHAEFVLLTCWSRVPLHAKVGRDLLTSA